MSMSSGPSGQIKVAVVTGAARGIGLATAKSLLAREYKVAMLDVDAAAVTSAARDLAAQPGTVLPVACDVSDPAQVQKAITRIEAELSRIDILVNNAGIGIMKPLADTSFADWRRVMAVNLDGVFLCSQACIPLMRRGGGGCIVNVASISGIRASTMRAAYGTSKAAVIHLTRQQAVELAVFGIRCNAVAPGPVVTAMTEVGHTPEMLADYHAAIPQGRYGTEQEIAAAIMFFCSPEASYITGQVLAADGGFAAAGIGLGALQAPVDHKS
jgi:meso-butanediol dehydrogenase/(S,S)-butanediol dehydrogenase/diacetyl reductase